MIRNLFNKKQIQHHIKCWDNIKRLQHQKTYSQKWVFGPISCILSPGCQAEASSWSPQLCWSSNRLDSCSPSTWYLGGIFLHTQSSLLRGSEGSSWGGNEESESWVTFGNPLSSYACNLLTQVNYGGLKCFPCFQSLHKFFILHRFSNFMSDEDALVEPSRIESWDQNAQVLDSCAILIYEVHEILHYTNLVKE